MKFLIVADLFFFPTITFTSPRSAGPSSQEFLGLCLDFTITTFWLISVLVVSRRHGAPEMRKRTKPWLLQLGMSPWRQTGRAVGPTQPCRHIRPSPSQPHTRTTTATAEALQTFGTTDLGCSTSGAETAAISTFLFGQPRLLATRGFGASLVDVMTVSLSETGQGGRVSPSTHHARWRTVMRNNQRVCSHHKPSILFCHTINQNTFTRKDGCALHTAANSDTAAWRLADFLHLPSTYHKHKGTNSVSNCIYHWSLLI